MHTKLCRVCRNRKPVTEFHVRKAYKDGLDTRCKECELIYDRQRIAKHPGPKTTGTKICSSCKIEKNVIEFSKRLRSKDGLRNRCKKCDRQAEKEYRTQNPNQRYLNVIRQKYGLLPEDYLNMLKKQKYQCLICNKTEKLVVDHCHTTLKIRGLLCQNCNAGIGMFGDDIESLKNAIRYLE